MNDSSGEYPELVRAAESIADNTCREINRMAAATKSEMPYKAQAILEHVIEILQERV